MICPKLTELQSLSTNEQSEGGLECKVSPCITSQGSQLPLSLSVFSIFKKIEVYLVYNVVPV